MNISVMMTYFKYLLLMGIMCAFVSCQREALPSELPDGKAIELTASSDWPKFSKAPITGLNDLKGDGFVVWGAWEKETAVFGTYGTKVSAVTGTDGNVEADNWEYSPVRYWFAGNYKFAALLPASAVALSTTGTGVLAVMNGYDSSLILDNSFTLGGKSVTGTELADGDQVDLMYAFSNVDNSGHKDAKVNLVFKHLWAQVGFKLKYLEYKGNPIVIDNVKIYGMGNTVDFDGNVIVNDDETSNMSAIRTALSGAVKSTSSNPFAIFNLSAEVGKNEEVTLVDKLMVFPIDLTSMPVTVEVSFKYGNDYGNELTLRGSINSGEWISGKRYSYPLEVGANSINFGEPAVTDWVKESISVDIDKAND